MPLKTMDLGTSVGVEKWERNEHTWLGFLILEETRLLACLDVHQESRIPCGLRSAIYRRSANKEKKKKRWPLQLFLFFIKLRTAV